jgi:glycine/D-amino acid oxidase-like deaminating enzyme/nitrite reductase/ring-hydroxylating ferredoxin subunit
MTPVAEPGGERQSYWIASAAGGGFPSLDGAISVDVAIVGAGITGLTAATLLKQAGKSVAVIESKQVARGTTGYTTAKVTAGHRLVYKDLRSKFGEDGARLYAESQQAALERTAALIEERAIECDFRRRAHYVYAESDSDVSNVEDEVEAEQKVGLPASFVQETTLPFEVAGALRLDDQAEFHPRKYLLPLAEALPGDGSHLFEQTRVLDVDEGSPCVIHTAQARLTAEDVIIATSLPILDRGLFFAKAHPYRSYALALPIARSQAPAGMFINSGGSTRSMRTTPEGERLLLIVNGNGHKTGEEPENEQRYQQLHEFARSRFGLDEIAYRWSTQDFYTLDEVPYIGRLRRRSHHLFVATGFNGWGMTGGTLAAMILSDLILGNDNRWAQLYDAKRLKLRGTTSMFVKENAKVAQHWLGDGLARGDAARVEDVAVGEGAIVRVHTERIALYRDEQGVVHALSPVCTHLACHVSWNRAEKSWDCPCHGSRFSGEGAVIQGPAVRDLSKLDLDRLGAVARQGPARSGVGPHKPKEAG